MRSFALACVMFFGLLCAVSLSAGRWGLAIDCLLYAAPWFLLWQVYGEHDEAFERGRDEGYREGLIASRAGKGWVE